MSILTFSIIVPTFKRIQKLENCLKSLASQSFPSSDYEVIVVDDGAENAVAEFVKKQHPHFSCCVLAQNHMGAAALATPGRILHAGDIWPSPTTIAGLRPTG